MPTTEQIVNYFHERKNSKGPIIARMTALKDAVNGDMVIPLPELDVNEKPMTANLIAQGLDQNAQRIASVLPDIDYLATRDSSDAARQRARDRRLANLAWWSMSELGLAMYQRARYMIGYACSPVLIKPDFKRRSPKWEVHNPLSTFEPPGDDMTPTDSIFLTRHTLADLRLKYPDQMGVLSLGTNPRPDTMFDCLYYVDADEQVSVCLGRSLEARTQTTETGLWITGTPWGAPKGAPYSELMRLPNPAGICPAVVPGRISLDRRQGQFDSLVGIYWTMSKLMALEVIGVQRSIFRDEWIVSSPGQQAQVISEADGLRGVRGELQGGDIKALDLSPGFQTYPTIDRLERNMRIAGGIPAEFGGESQTNVRTDRRGRSILSAAVDFPIREVQQVFEVSLRAENTRAIAIDKAYWGAQTKSFFFSWNGAKGRGSYSPDDLWETDEHVVAYAFPGSDLNGLITGLGQRKGMETMSTRTVMELDPMISDPDFEERKITQERLHAAFLTSIETQAAQGALPPVDMARISELVMRGAPLYKAVQTAQKEAQERQASSGEEGAPDGPVAPGSPEAQPGLGAPGMGAEVPEAIGEGPPSIGNLAGIFRNLSAVR